MNSCSKCSNLQSYRGRNLWRATSFLSGFWQGPKVGTLPFLDKTKEPECLDFKGFQAPKEQGMRESNSHQRFWRPLSYHLTNPLSKPTCKISFTVAIIHIKATIVKLIVHFYYKEFYKERAEMEGFEPSHRLPGLPHFECGPFSLLGTSPY